MREAAELLERESALGEIDALLRSILVGDGRVLMVEGEAGTGKSALVRRACEQAQASAVSVLRARGGALERDFGFGVARQLFEPELARANKPRLTKLLAGAARLAGPVVGFGEQEASVGPAAADPSLAAQHGLYWLTANIAGSGPLLLCVDDVHWADRASLAWLLYLARRLEGLAVGVIVGNRIGEPAAAGDDVRAMRAEDSTTTVTLSSLTPQAADLLIDRALPSRPDAAFRAACHAVTGGNPFFLNEVVAAVVEEGIEPVAANIGLIEGLGRDRAAEHILMRLGRLGADAGRMARAVAVLGSGATLRRAALLSHLGPEQTRVATDALVAGRVLTTGDPTDFVHPLVRAAVYEDLPAAERAGLHRAAAKLLDQDGAVDEAAVHLLPAERTGDPWVVERLLSAGRRDRDRGGGDSAVQLLRRALHEPPTADLRVEVLLELGRSERLSAMGDALEHLQAARELAKQPSEIEAATHELAYLLGLKGDIESGAAQLEASIAEIGNADTDAVARLEVDLMSLLLNHDDTFERGAQRLADVLPTVPPDSPVHCALLGLDTWARFESGRGTVDDMEQVGLRALVGTTLMDFGPDALPLQAGIVGLTRSDRIDITGPLLDRVLEESRRRGSVWGIAAAHSMRCQDAFWVGDARLLEQEAEAALEFSGLAGAPLYFAAGLTCLVVALVQQGRYEAADSLLATYGFATMDPPKFVLARLILLARSRLRSAQGRHEEAVADALAGLARDRQRYPDSPALYSLPEVAAALHAAGDDDAARSVAEEYLAAASKWGSAGEIGRATRLVGVTAQSGDGVRLLRESVDLLAPTRRRFEHALALIDLGVALRRSGEPTMAREPLLAGMELAYRCGATAEVDRARSELGAAGARPRSSTRTGPDSLTAAERRVAALAAAGRNNPAIAQALFLSRRTVEAHLRSIFRKLDIRSRDDLRGIVTASGM